MILPAIVPNLKTTIIVKVAIAGGSGNVAQEIINVLVAANKHQILLLSRQDAPAGFLKQNLTWVKVDYQDPDLLVQILQGVHTVLSFISTLDPVSIAQKNLIDASVQAGVKRFAPSEWSRSAVLTSDVVSRLTSYSAGLEHLSWYTFKAETRRYLKQLNKDRKVLEYGLFQPGLFLNYLTRPYKSSEHVHMMEIHIDFDKCRALVLDGGENDHITLTTVQDLANVVVRAIDFEGEWPVVGGIKGTNMTVGQLIALGEKIRGVHFIVEKLKANELESGLWETSWMPKLDHPSIPQERVDTFSKIIVASPLLATSAKA